jgi:hypothetical protein
MYDSSTSTLFWAAFDIKEVIDKPLGFSLYLLNRFLDSGLCHVF